MSAGSGGPRPAGRAEIAGWGRWPKRLCTLHAPGDPAEAAALAARLSSMIPRGLARSYGDSTLNPQGVVLTRRLDRMVSFDAETGVLVAEAGVSLAEVIGTFLPRGFFPAVTPGSKFVTLGGAVAADVHGKNHHHAGAFGDHVLWLELADGAGGTLRCSREEAPELFNATFGAMGLTGIVLRVALRLLPVETGWIRQRTLPAGDLDEAMALFEAHLDAPYSVAWIDCLARGAARGRSLLHLGAHARLDELPEAARAAPFEVPRRTPRRVPVDAPSIALNRLSVGLFNRLYYAKGRRAGAALVDWDRYFYPLDALHEWNRIYGARGFAQYQCALPLPAARDALAEMLDAIAADGSGSFLSVLKRFGEGAAERPLSFPMAGYTLALDFPVSAGTLRLMDRLDRITVEAGGRLYLAKDSRMTPETFRAGYGQAIERLAAVRRALPHAARLGSSQSRRLGL